MTKAPRGARASSVPPNISFATVVNTGKTQNRKSGSALSGNSKHTNVGVAFALYLEDKEIKWLYVGCRCVNCGVLGCFAGWKVGYAPSRQLFDLV